MDELRLLAPILALCVWGTLNATTSPWLATVALGLAMQQAGWLGHDMVHARNSTYCSVMVNVLAGWIAGFDRNWWSNKHNTHHVLTNHVGADPDIDMMPILFLMAPSKTLDHHARRWQHVYAWPVYGLLYYLWRWSSLQQVVRNRDAKGFFLVLLPSIVWLACLPFWVAVGSVGVGGFLVGLVVVQSHECEELTHGETPGSFAETQFKSTRDIMCPDPFTEYLFGGMQYQLTHHLFPTLPRYKYAALQPKIIAWAEKHGLEYKRASVAKCTKDHYDMLYRNAVAARNEGCSVNGWSSKSTR